MERKIEVYKDSKGKLHEDRNDYYVEETKIIHNNNIEMWRNWLELVESDPEMFYKIMMNFTKIIESKTPDENQKSFEEKINFIKEAKRIVNETREYNRFYPNPNWNDSPGDWLGISAQDLGVPNC